MDGLTDRERTLARAHGVATEYEDWRGETVTVPEPTVLAVLAALDVNVSASATKPDAESATRAHALLPPCVVTIQGQQSRLELADHIGSDVEVWLDLEDETRVGVDVNGRTVVVPDDLPLGYHTLVARRAGDESTSSVIVTPVFLGFPERLGSRRGWGLAVQLYSVRSHDSWGVGDLRDLERLATWAAELGADFILANPLSAAEPVAPMEPSPYLPSSRRFVNPLYIRVEEIPEYADLSPSDRAAVDALRAGVHRQLDSADTIDRDTSWTAKAAALRLVYGAPRPDEREARHTEFVRREGSALRDFATWCALVELHGADWHGWPSELQQPQNADVEAFRAAHAGTVRFHCWLQWVLDEQLESVQAAATAAGMGLGVMHDLAVGVHPCGGDSWALQNTLAQGISVGAPPDAFNQVGQDWSQPPWRPDRLVELGYGPFRDLVSTLLRHAGALRIDHILGLFRLWWIPQGSGAEEGTYVRYDHEALIGILALEAHRAGAVVVGEDLGTVEPHVHDYLRDRGITGTSILWFERDENGDPLPPERWREYCLASVGTHDLPPTLGYLAGDHVELRSSLGLLNHPVEEERADDEAKQAAWMSALCERGLLPEKASPDETVTALHRYLTLTPARLLLVALTDAVGDRRTQNQPGTTDEYPNWRVPLCGPGGTPMLLDDVLYSPTARALAETVEEGLRPR